MFNTRINLTRPSCYHIEIYPELAIVQRSWPEIREEALALRPDMIWIEDERTRGHTWAFGPLVPEEEDRDDVLDALSARLRERAPFTMRLMATIPELLACGFSMLCAGERIGLHAHPNQFLTAMLGLAGGSACTVRVGAESRPIRPGDLLLFDYSLPHEVVNAGPDDRLVLLMLIPPSRWP